MLGVLKVFDNLKIEMKELQRERDLHRERELERKEKTTRN